MDLDKELEKYQKLKKQQAAASKRYYAKLYKNTTDLSDDMQRVVADRKQKRAEYQREKYLANRDYYLEYSRKHRAAKKAASAESVEPANQ